MLTIKFRINILFFLLLLSLIAVSCAQGGEGEMNPQLTQAENTPIRFTTSLKSADARTRATYPVAGGQIDDAALQTAGFGVFAQHTQDVVWAGYTKTVPYNFMWNQQVDWDGGTSAWSYSPVKYWPNDNQPADDQSATGSLEHSYLTFFAYAPYVTPTTVAAGFDVKDVDENSDSKPDHDGLVKLTGNTTNADASYIYYRTSLAAPFGSEESVDLLWAAQPNRYKTDGGGYVSGHVDFAFKHALSLVGITVQGLFDHKDNDDATTLYPDDRDIYTKILVERVDMNGSPIFTEGKMYIAPRPADATVPHWEVNDEDLNSDLTPDHQGTIEVSAEHVNPVFANRYLDGTWQKYWDEADMAGGMLKETDVDESGEFDAGDALALFNQLPKGVSHTEVPLNNTAYDPESDTYEDYFYMVLPNDEYRAVHSTEKMKVRMVYYVITYDERLTLVNPGRPRYFSIVKNDVTAEFDEFSLAPNKKYKLRLQPGLTSVKFEVTAVDGWDTPLTLDPEVVDWYTKTMEFNVK